ncbi:flagellar filament capping protein FliD [Anaerovorax sp. IOR16]|uniref:flagellar filament capping protein FliD n=1 Tax=Anaerovorax sp. IOR16 TaxID=2773458 RepID=UPI0019D20F33|nr:flagellar filament capping protein FliD [Anaerovorax sp. IOR16]
MSTSISSSSSVITTSSSKRLTGLMSNMDTDQIVKDMSSGTLTKIAKLKQKRQTLEWRQNAFRSVTTSLLNFSNQFLSSTSMTNLKKSSFFKSAVITSLGSNASAASVSGTADSIRNFSIGSIDKLATTAGITTDSNHKISTRNITTGEIDFLTSRDVSALEDTSITLSYGNDTFFMKLSDIELSSNADPSIQAQENAENLEAALNSALKAGGLNDLVSAELGTDGKITFRDLKNDGNELKVTGGSTALLNVLGLETGDSTSDGTLTGTNDLRTEELVKQVTFGESIANGNGTFTLDLNGVKAVVNLKELVNEDGSFKDPTMNMEKLATHINGELDKTYGTGKVNVSAVNVDGTPIAADATQGKLVFETTSTTSILSVASGDSGILGASGAMNMNLGDANRLLVFEPLTSSRNNLNAALDFSGGNTHSMTINDVDFEVGSDFIKVNGEQKDFAKGVTVNDIINTVNNSDAGVVMKYLSTSDRFSLTASQSGSVGKTNVTGTLGDALFGAEATRIGETEGTDSEMKVSFDGGRSYETITRSSNTFTLDGMDVTLNSTFTSQAVDAVTGTGDAITFSSKANADEVVDAVKSMIEEYNKMIEMVNTTVSTKPVRNKSGGGLTYQPLTDEQKEEMSDKEIEKWEQKAQEGILFADPLLRSLSSDLRFVFAIQVDGVSMNQIGIKTGTSYKDNGKISFDETQFRKALEEKPDAVAKLFNADGSNASGEKGAISKIEEIITRYANTSGSQKGSLIQKAGHSASPMSELDNVIYKEIRSLSDQIDTWEDKLKIEQDRYYSKFTNLEVYLNKMNAQSGWLMQQVGS